jgi:RNA polymerase sigma-70 factor (ECF subfamily)
MEDADTPIVRAVQAGDVEAYELLVERHQGRVLSVLRNALHDDLLAEEVAQETFVKAYLGLPSFRGESRFGTWLLQIAIHAARDRRRSARRSRTFSLEELLEADRVGGAAAAPPELADPHPASDPFVLLERAELAHRLESGLRELPDDYREVFVLKHVEGLAYEDIATITGDSVGTLKVRAHRARQKLRAWIEQGDTLPSPN